MKKENILITIIMVSAYIVCVTSGMLFSEYTQKMELPYYEGIYIEDGFESWNKSVVNISVTGNPSSFDWFCVQDVLNEWNTKVVYPKLGYSNTYPDITIAFVEARDEEWAGATWAGTDGNKTLMWSYIEVRTSWPLSREHVIRHELGHAMGLCYHSNHPDSTMYGWATGVGQWSQEDIQIIEQLYSGNRFPTV